MKIKNILTVSLCGILILFTGVFFIFKEKNIYSLAERRKLADFPEFNAENIMSGEYMSDFEEALKDNHPFREYMRKIKAYTVMYPLNQLDNNGVFLADNYISKSDYPLDKSMLDYSAKCFENVYNMYFKNTQANIYFSIIPDKNMYLKNKSDILTYDYDNLISYMKDKTLYMKYIDITHLLNEEDYFYTDSHWKQEEIINVAEYLSEEMNFYFYDDFNIKTVDDKFYGIYYGQSALNHKGDSLCYLTNDIIDNLKVTIYPEGMAEESPVYNMENLNSKYPYDMFLSGSQPIVEIENQNQTNNKKLIIFRDSFMSGLAPLLSSGYSKITLIDIRYIYPSLISEYIEENADVLFMYSTIILNSSLGLKYN